MTIGTGTTLVGLINAMIGAYVLVIPILSLQAGYSDWIVGCVLLACISTYTAYLLVRHLGKAPNIKNLILNHFKGDHFFTTLYNIVIWFSFMGAEVIYFKLFCIQIKGLFGELPFLPEAIAIFLIVWVIALRESDLSQIALASGIISMIGFVVYLMWVIVTAPSGPNYIPIQNPHSDILILTLLNAYTAHDFLIQVITFNSNRRDYTKIVVLLFLIASLVFLLCCYSASALINRTPGIKDPETIIDFFQGSKNEGWNLTVLEFLYVIHILTAFPEYLIVSKIRIFQIFEIEHDTSQDISSGEIFYTIVIVLICYLPEKLGISLSLLLDISGGVLGYLFSMFIPIFIHLKCIHFDRSSGYIEGDDERNLTILSNECQCDLVYRSKFTLWFETFILIFIDIYGGYYFMNALGDQVMKELYHK